MSLGDRTKEAQTACRRFLTCRRADLWSDPLTSPFRLEAVSGNVDVAPKVANRQQAGAEGTVDLSAGLRN
jgi:hypothetical protein